QHGRGDVGVEIAVMAGLDGGLQARAMVERKQHVVDRRAVGHGVTPRWLEPSSHETAGASTTGTAARHGSQRSGWGLNAAGPYKGRREGAGQRAIFTIGAVEMAIFSL